MQVQIPQKSLPKTFKRFLTQVLYFSIIPFFFLVFAALYKPFNMDTWLNTSKASYSFNIAMIMCIILLVMVASRLTLYFSRAINHISITWYRIWCAGEVVLSSFFVALYVSLIGDYNLQYLEVLVRAFGFLALILMFPYLFLEQLLSLNAVKEADDDGAHQESKLHFYDSRHSLKFVVAAENILYIKADENYITIHYMEAGKKKMYEMRSSMKNIEEICLANGILRCHRSYFVNPVHIKALRKDKENIIVAELDTPELPPIPISKRYYEDLVKVI